MHTHACYVSSLWRAYKVTAEQSQRMQLNFSLRGYKSPVLCRPQDDLLPLDYFFALSSHVTMGASDTL
jgi:hypothetical protein